MNKDFDKHNPVCKCLLDNGAIVEYDGCCALGNESFYSSDKWELIGSGIIWSVDGVRQNSEDDKLFFRRKGA